MKEYFTPKEVAKLVDISYKQIEYWDKTRFISPSSRRRGNYRAYTFQDLIQLKFVKILRDNGFSIQKLRGINKQLRDLLPQVSAPLEELTLLVEGERILIFSGDLLLDHSTQNRYIQFVVKELHDRVEELYPQASSLWLKTGSSGAEYVNLDKMRTGFFNHEGHDHNIIRGRENENISSYL